MKKFLAAIVTAAGVALAASSAHAQFNWTGMYVGGVVGAYDVLENNPPLEVGIVAGINRALGGSVVVGVETQTLYISGWDSWQWLGRSRIGTTLGVEDRLLIYAGAGFAAYTGGKGWWYASFFGGTELALGPNISLRTELSTLQYQGCFWCTDFMATSGLILHLGR